ncbi:L,D-transpeptidase/peptidoglycan binding protein [Clostridium sp. D2Q-11]|uniref:L,D-transpeptidase/peptidoglycan binding protein n=1 Tax=Anaeromonas frigoriresistens TaxID=2683708 RepID=A0A942UZ57_9FIRM|nr:L,D-transpeptidase family protein [Anaeromonas frigoriresistens]MBS4538981.1 L,D-transpeptidase/peptidoglycan binding protein [Anaeromonas frigoriresistens]
MKNINRKNLFKSESLINAFILIALILLLYLITSLYFINHCFFNTVINGVDVSLKSHDDVEDIIKSYIVDYRLQLIERNGEIEEIIGKNIEMQYNVRNNIHTIYRLQNSFKWGGSLFKKQRYYVDNLFMYNEYKLENKINQLNCLNEEIIEPQNVSFKYENSLYEVSKEVYGNKINKYKLIKNIKMSILHGETILDLNENFCYENPKYTLSSDKTLKTKNLLNKYISTNITYLFGKEKEILDANKINQWLSVDENLEVEINKSLVYKYIQELSEKYDTVGVARRIKTSTNKIVEVKGGFYGWKINRIAETEALVEHIKHGKVLKKEPKYIQRALYRGEDDIGNTYVEINITRQHLWFYKDGKLITHGPIVTGNPNKGYSTKVGVYMLNYKEKGSTLRGQNYEAKVTYWMPFNGNIGIHDARWRYSFGGDIYIKNGSHGCVNAPLYLAKKIFDNIEDGTPIICYEE